MMRIFYQYPYFLNTYKKVNYTHVYYHYISIQTRLNIIILKKSELFGEY